MAEFRRALLKKRSKRSSRENHIVWQKLESSSLGIFVARLTRVAEEFIGVACKEHLILARRSRAKADWSYLTEEWTQARRLL